MAHFFDDDFLVDIANEALPFFDNMDQDQEPQAPETTIESLFDSELSLPADEIPNPFSTWTFYGLLGENTQTRITGSDASLTALSLAIMNHTLTVSPQPTPDVAGDVFRSLHTTGNLQLPFPPITLREVTEALGRRHPFTVRDQTAPRISSLHVDLDRVLVTLGLIAAREGMGRRWQIGLLTLDGESGNVFLDVLSLDLAEVPTDTAWVWRWCGVDGEGARGEVWYSVFPRNYRVARDIGLQAVEDGSNASVRLSSQAEQDDRSSIRLQQPMSIAAAPAAPPAAAPQPSAALAPPTINGVVVAPVRPQAVNGVKGRLRPANVAAAKFDSRAVFSGLTDDEVFSGEVDPDDICGSLINDLASRYSNAHLAGSINALYTRSNRPTVNKNTITKRITNNLKAQTGIRLETAAGNDQGYQDARGQMNATREAAGLNYHNGYGDQGKTGRNKAGANGNSQG